ncbi:acyltransferase [Spirosoma sp. BT702]|uniref:Acyltransferase n=1 Tax=Spirosoma profusum TaxID=2771354 RepID=A0A926Y585_9BACT|nr:acyltransferase [Spirosoma profusum]MBD2704181.1 acyltransferase [Spirosoma profusum]
METEKTRMVWLDYLRAFVTLLVVAHHAALAYPTFAYFNPAHYISSTAPIVDEQRWAGMDTLIGFNDIFFMPLMFFISGLFVYRGLTKKGVKSYLKDRLLRLGLPFLVAEVVLIPLAYLPTYYVATHDTSLSGFLNDYIFTQEWPVGPPWFIWLLLAFDVVAALIFSEWPTFFTRVGQWLTHLSEQPLRLGAVLYVVVALSFIPLSLWVGQYTWIGNWGPFDFQLNRVIFYLLFFLLGGCLGATFWQNYFFHNNRLFGIGWPFWLGVSLVCYVLIRLVAEFGAEQVKQGNWTETIGYLFFDLAFIASCLTSICACLSVFRQTIFKPNLIWQTLSANAYGIYVVHYCFVTWLQFALLRLDVVVSLKFTFVFIGALGLSYLSSRLLRQNISVAKIL